MKLIQQIQLIQRTDHLIRRRATGNPRELARKLQLSTSGVSRLIRMMRALEAPIVFRDSINSYVYTEEVSFRIGFGKELSKEELTIINGGSRSGLFHIGISRILKYSTRLFNGI